MSEAILNLVTRDAVELHFGGVTYGPVAHTESLGVLLFALSPATVRCIARESAFEAAMGRLLSAAQEVCSCIRDAADEREPGQRLRDVAPPGFQQWLEAALRAVPAMQVDWFLRLMPTCQSPSPSRNDIH
jgi:hypothetical protein